MLTTEQIKELRKNLPFPPLEESIAKAKERSHLHHRPLVGRNSVLLRTIGDNFKGPNHYEKTYFNESEGEEAETEFAEFMRAVEKYDRDPSKEKKAELLLETADILYQEELIDTTHKRDPNYVQTKIKIAEVVNYTFEQLRSRRIDPEDACLAARIKYGARLWCKSKGFDSKNKELERDLLLEVL